MTRTNAPSRAHYGWGVMIVGIGALLVVLLLQRGIPELTGGMIQLVMPGTVEVELAEPGTYTVYHEHESLVDGRVYRTGDHHIAGLRIRVHDATDGREIPLSQPGGQSSYELGNRSGVSIAKFTITEGGRYAVVGTFDDEAHAEPLVLALSRGFLRRMVALIGAGFGIMGGFGAAGIVAWVMVWRRRNHG